MSAPTAGRAAPAALPRASRERILDAALELLARYGVVGMSLQLLADHVGLHKSTLFHHFGGKQEIIDEVTGRIMDEVLARLGALAADDPPDLERFVEVALALDAYFAEHRFVALAVARELLGPHDPASSEQTPHTERFFALLSDWLDRARRSGAVRPLSVPQAIVNLIALSVFYPALVDQFGDAFAIEEPRSEPARRRRRRELAETLRRALAP